MNRASPGLFGPGLWGHYVSRKEQPIPQIYSTTSILQICGITSIFLRKAEHFSKLGGGGGLTSDFNWGDEETLLLVGLYFIGKFGWGGAVFRSVV